MARATYADLVAEVRAQIDVDSSIALAWLLDRSRVLNAEAAWTLALTDLPAQAGQRSYSLPADALWVEAVLVDVYPFQRSTLHAMDARWSGQTGNTTGIYADSIDSGWPVLQLHPPPGTGSEIHVRYVEDLPDNLTTPPFPTDFDQALVDGAIAIGLARMDERFDSAGYFETRFVDAVARLKRRRHGRVGRGAVPIRVAL
jgi:hypothetical protein